MKKVRISKGRNVYDFFVLPTIRITKNGDFYTYVTVEWLCWYFGFTNAV